MGGKKDRTFEAEFGQRHRDWQRIGLYSGNGIRVTLARLPKSNSSVNVTASSAEIEKNLFAERNWGIREVK